MINDILLDRIKAAPHLKKLSLKKLTALYNKLHVEYEQWQSTISKETSDESSSDG